MQKKSSKAIGSSDEMARAELAVHFVDLEHQVGSKDCGLFAITFAQVLCDNIDPHLTGHYQKIMREHFIKCAKEEEVVAMTFLSSKKVKAEVTYLYL